MVWMSLTLWIPGHVDHLAPELRRAADRLVHGVQARDAADEERLPRASHLDGAEDENGEEDRGEEGVGASGPEPVVVGAYGLAHDRGTVDRRRRRLRAAVVAPEAAAVSAAWQPRSPFAAARSS